MISLNVTTEGSLGCRGGRGARAGGVVTVSTAPGTVRVSIGLNPFFSLDKRYSSAAWLAFTFAFESTSIRMMPSTIVISPHDNKQRRETEKQCFSACSRCLEQKGRERIGHKSFNVLKMLDVKASYDSKETVKMQLNGEGRTA